MDEMNGEPSSRQGGNWNSEHHTLKSITEIEKVKAGLYDDQQGPASERVYPETLGW